MLSPATLLSTKYRQVGTPVTYTNNLKPPSRRLCHKEDDKRESQEILFHHKHRIVDDEKWDVIQSPQFIDFSNLPEVVDSFSNKLTVIVSTPNPNLRNESLPKTVTADEDTLVASLDTFSLSSIKYENSATTILENYNYQKEEDEEEYTVHHVSAKKELKVKTETRNTEKKPQNTAVYPFSFDLRQKHMQERRQERIKKILEEENKVRQFRANPIPKFLKSRPVTIHNHENTNHGNNNNDNQGNLCNNPGKKAGTSNMSTKKSTELWKKSPFVPSLSRKKLERPRTPPLKTASRAQQRKRFDEGIKEKEKQREKIRQMEIAAKKKQEEEELLILRKQLCFKAQPIRKYKTDFMRVEKRPLTDPVSPITLKRRRKL